MLNYLLYFKIIVILNSLLVNELMADDENHLFNNNKHNDKTRSILLEDQFKGKLDLNNSSLIYKYENYYLKSIRVKYDESLNDGLWYEIFRNLIEKKNDEVKNLNFNNVVSGECLNRAIDLVVNFLNRKSWALKGG